MPSSLAFFTLSRLAHAKQIGYQYVDFQCVLWMGSQHIVKRGDTSRKGVKYTPWCNSQYYILEGSCLLKTQLSPAWLHGGRFAVFL
ncbi:hypothetical protein BC943DRAFT_66472 [Umbelopsis sp. AD052]|nr:hypothetical protein BC943DRAFT_66472 [Umbelopsis sp. AD052]